MANELGSRNPGSLVEGSTGGMTRRYAVLGAGFGLAFPVIATAISLGLRQLPTNLLSIIAVQRGEPLLWIIDTAPLFLGLFASMAGRRQDALIARNRQLQAREGELTSIRATLEERVEQRTDELAKRNEQMRAAVLTTQQMAASADTSSLLAAAVKSLAQNFAGYQAHVYLLDDRRRTAVLAASSTEAAATAPRAGHSIDVGDASIIGQVAAGGKLRVFPTNPTQGLDAESDFGLSREGAEVAVPLIARGQILGVLDIVTSEGRPIDEAEAETLQLLGDQLAASIDNARLFAETRASLQRVQDASGQGTRLAWQEYVRRHEYVFQYTPAGVKSVPEGLSGADPHSLRVPLQIRGQPIGAVVLRRKAGEAWSDADRDLAEKVATQAALALENNRLLEETRERALQEQQLSEISARLSGSVDVDTLLQNAVRELAGLPEVSEVSVFLNPVSESGEETLA